MHHLVAFRENAAISAGAKPLQQRYASAFDLGEVRHCACRLADLAEELEAILAQLRFVGALGNVNGYLVEEGIDMRPQLRHRAHGLFEILSRNRSPCLGL